MRFAWESDEKQSDGPGPVVLGRSRPKLSASRHLCPFRLLRVSGLRGVGPRRSASSLPSRTSQQQGFLDNVCGLSLFALTAI
jgi:hypothetical protein